MNILSWSVPFSSCAVGSSVSSVLFHHRKMLVCRLRSIRSRGILVSSSGIRMTDTYVSVEGNWTIEFIRSIIDPCLDVLHQSTASATVSDRETGEETEVLLRRDSAEANKPVTFFRAWLLPGVLMVRTDLSFHSYWRRFPVDLVFPLLCLFEISQL